jgi:hypothetical protein
VVPNDAYSQYLIPNAADAVDSKLIPKQTKFCIPILVPLYNKLNYTGSDAGVAIIGKKINKRPTIDFVYTYFLK